MLSYERMLRSERILDMHMKARDTDRAGPAHDQVITDADTFEHDPAISPADARLKLRATARALEAGDTPEWVAEWLAPKLRSSKVPQQIDGAWLCELRAHLEAVELYAPDNTAAANLLRSILVGLSGPRPL